MKRIIDISEELYHELSCKDKTNNLDYVERAILDSTPFNEVEAEDCISKIADYDLSMGQVVKGIHALPSVYPKSDKPSGKWIDTGCLYHHYYNDGDIETTELKCSCCGEIVEWDIELPHKPYYCENCGAKMEQEQGEQK